MVAEVFSAMIQGIEGQIVKIQVDISNGLPNFNMIGYLSNEVKESKERVRTALNNIGVLLPPKRISVNFAPADFRKCGTSFDIGVAAAILLAMDFVPETYANLLFGDFPFTEEYPVSNPSTQYPSGQVDCSSIISVLVLKSFVFIKNLLGGTPRFISQITWSLIV